MLFVLSLSVLCRFQFPFLKASCPVLFQDYSWTDIRCPFEKRRDAACVFWDNVVYILGGSQLFPIKRMDCYNVVKDSWYSKLGPPTPRDSLAACAAEGKIYTSGGSEVGKTLLILLFNRSILIQVSWHLYFSKIRKICPDTLNLNTCLLTF